MLRLVALKDVGNGAAAGGSSPIPEELRFRSFRLLPGARLLLKEDEPVAIGSRAFDILQVLARARGTLVSKNDIVDAVWPTTIVEESNLRFQVAQLRKALGRDQDLVKTIPGRGYLLVAECGSGGEEPPSTRGAGHPLAPEALNGPLLHEEPPPVADTEAQLRSALTGFLRACGLGDAKAVLLYVGLPEGSALFSAPPTIHEN